MPGGVCVFNNQYGVAKLAILDDSKNGPKSSRNSGELLLQGQMISKRGLEEGVFVSGKKNCWV